jgi:hypothetical protein
MQLLMLFGNEVIDRINIDGNNKPLPEHLVRLQEALIVRNQEELECCADEPRFELGSVSSQQGFRNVSTSSR